MKTENYNLPDRLMVARTSYPDGRQTTYSDGMTRLTLQDLYPMVKKKLFDEASKNRVKEMKVGMKLIKSKTA